MRASASSRTVTLHAPTVRDVGRSLARTSPHEGYSILSTQCSLCSCITGAPECSATQLRCDRSSPSRRGRSGGLTLIANPCARSLST